MLNANWYILQTTPLYEKTVMRHINNLIESGNYPDIVSCRMLTETVQKESKNRKGESVMKEVEEKLFPCYLFVKMIYNPTVLTMIRLMTGVSRWVGIGYDPIPLTQSELSNYPDLMEFNESEYKEGESVRITSGPLEGFKGKYKSYDANSKQIVVECEMFGRLTPGTVEIHQIEHYTGGFDNET